MKKAKWREEIKGYVVVIAGQRYDFVAHIDEFEALTNRAFYRRRADAVAAKKRLSQFPTRIERATITLDVR